MAPAAKFRFGIQIKRIDATETDLVIESLTALALSIGVPHSNRAGLRSSGPIIIVSVKGLAYLGHPSEWDKVNIRGVQETHRV